MERLQNPTTLSTNPSIANAATVSLPGEQFSNATCADPTILMVGPEDIVNSVQSNCTADNLSLRLVMTKKLPKVPVVKWRLGVCSVPVRVRL
ncbi:hypothetical protein [Paraburkholderia silvatlantica]|uniref:Uncharacterized protein n=1 Tax=Paraburkholderia silvatlantica TaxID=321895 RepID=A0ABR6FZC7_9BURK|nr:hypothetical protein [Paraburkholderia silvatlantica]MBB2932797.1 hypothetical protein [Paraburkholderia silvatlantica]PVY20767.1 hypothetical protein C7411_13942 [Paraburkholderia silvatlantica]PXW25207.1 hypothetical protein C7413_14142 [Paraburkholderia silvatlantica]